MNGMKGVCVGGSTTVAGGSEVAVTFAGAMTHDERTCPLCGPTLLKLTLKAPSIDGFEVLGSVRMNARSLHWLRDKIDAALAGAGSREAVAKIEAAARHNIRTT